LSGRLREARLYVPTRRNREAKRAQHVAPNHVVLKFCDRLAGASVGLVERAFDFDPPFHRAIL